MTDEYFMKKALAQAENAFAAGEFPVGCVIADKENILVTGFRQSTGGQHSNEIDHAEIVALRAFYEKKAVKNMNELTLYCTMEPCLMCFGAILISGIHRIVYAYEDVMGAATKCDLSKQRHYTVKMTFRLFPMYCAGKASLFIKNFFHSLKMITGKTVCWRNIRWPKNDIRRA